MCAQVLSLLFTLAGDSEAGLQGQPGSGVRGNQGLEEKGGQPELVLAQTLQKAW